MNRSIIFALGLLLTTACGDDGGQPSVTFFDSGVPDAAPLPDAEPCALTLCDGLCVDTSSDPLNCGGCGMACNSPGQICTGTTPCACPDPFVPAQIGGALDQVMMQGDFYAAIAPQLSTPFNVFAIIYDLTLDTGVEYDFADSVGGLTPPVAAAGYDVDINNFMAHTAYGSLQGTIIFDELCDTGVSGVISNVEFGEVLGVTNPTPVVGGCTMSYETLDFAIGSCPPVGGSDAGISDAGVSDAGVSDGGTQ